MEKLVANLSSKVQKKTLAGRNYLVAPVVMILEGVFTGNQGPLYYPAQDIAKSVSGWNHKPITVGHPSSPDGSKISGCDPAAIENFGVGMILNASWNSKMKKLRAEAWFEVDRLDAVTGGGRIKDALNKGEPVEVSTGLFVDNEMQSGTYQGREYSGKAKNFRPDHLAVLLHEVGACSIKDGAGLLVNKNAVPTPDLLVIHASVRFPKGTSLEAVTASVREAVYTKYRKESYFGSDSIDTGVFVVDVYPSHVIYMDGSDTYQENFTRDGDSVKLEGNRIQVVREVSYKPLVTNTKVDMDRETLLKAIGDEHKDFVANMSDAQVDALSKLEVERVVEKIVEKEVPVANAAPTNLDEVLALAPEAVKAQINEAFTVNANHRKALVEAVLANKANQFTADELATMSTGSLHKLSAFAVNAASPAEPKAPAVYAGSASASSTVVPVKGFVAPSTFVPKGE